MTVFLIKVEFQLTYHTNLKPKIFTLFLINKMLTERPYKFQRTSKLMEFEVLHSKVAILLGMWHATCNTLCS